MGASVQNTFRELRKQLVDDEILVAEDEKSFRFAKSYAFSSITAAAQVVSGQSVDGRIVWRRDDTEQTFADWQDASLPEPNHD